MINYLKNSTIYWNFINFWNMLKCNHGSKYLYEIDQRIPEKRCTQCDGYTWDQMTDLYTDIMSD